MAHAIFSRSMMGFRTTTRLTSIWFSVPLPLFSLFLTPSLIELYLFFSLLIFLSLHPSHTVASFFFGHSSDQFTLGYSTFLPNSVVVLAEFGSLASVASCRAHYWVSRYCLTVWLRAHNRFWALHQCLVSPVVLACCGLVVLEVAVRWCWW